MFDRYKIDDLFLASIEVHIPTTNYPMPPEVEALMATGRGISLNGCGITLVGHEYITVLTRQNGMFIDLNNPTINIAPRKMSDVSHSIKSIELFCRYYKPESDKRKVIFTKAEALEEAEKYYTVFLQDQEHSVQEEQGYQKVKAIKDM